MAPKISAFILAAVLLFSIPPLPARADPLPERAYLPNFTGYAQRFSLSCESRSAVDWAAYWGVGIREKKFLNSLPRSDNPDAGFVGSPNGEWGNVPPASYGVHAEPVAAVLRQFGLQAEARRGLSWDDLRQEIAAGRPVIVWVIGQMWVGSPQRYRASDGSSTIVARYEHTMILTGYNARSVRVVDAYTGAVQTYPLKTFIASWKTLGRMAVTGAGAAALPPAEEALAPPEEAPAPSVPKPGTPPPASFSHHNFMPLIFGPNPAQPAAPSAVEAAAPSTYRVRRGDYLKEVARSFGLDWRKLVVLNGLQPPFTIYTGQILRLR